MDWRNLFKKNRQQVHRENQQQGKEGERRVKLNYELNGYKVTRTGKSHDFKAGKPIPFSNKKETKYIEVKTGNSKLSSLHKKNKKQLDKKYVVEHPSTISEILGTSKTRKKKIFKFEKFVWFKHVEF